MSNKLLYLTNNKGKENDIKKKGIIYIPVWPKLLSLCQMLARKWGNRNFYN